MTSRLRLILYLSACWPFSWSMQKKPQKTHAKTSRLTSMHAVRLSLTRVLLSWGQINTCFSLFTTKLLILPFPLSNNVFALHLLGVLSSNATYSRDIWAHQGLKTLYITVFLALMGNMKYCTWKLLLLLVYFRTNPFTGSCTCTKFREWCWWGTWINCLKAWMNQMRVQCIYSGLWAALVF